MSDHELKMAVEAALRSRPALSRENIGTEVFASRVILVGEVETTSQEAEALAVAKSVPGVKEILSALRVAESAPKKAGPIDDETIRSHVESALLDHGLVLHSGGVAVSRGEVYLRGIVPSPIQKVQAERLATTIDGVRTVRSELRVEGRGPGVRNRRIGA